MQKRIVLLAGEDSLNYRHCGGCGSGKNGTGSATQTTSKREVLLVGSAADPDPVKFGPAPQHCSFQDSSTSPGRIVLAFYSGLFRNINQSIHQVRIRLPFLGIRNFRVPSQSFRVGI